MKFYSGYTLDEISEILSIPPGTVRSKLYRTLNSFRKELSNEQK
jgi:DNA-directed RNA polymerase specialized sigma24 family protein